MLRAKQPLAEAGCPNGLEIDVTSTNYVSDSLDVMEAEALRLGEGGIRGRRPLTAAPKDAGTFNPKLRARRGVVGPLQEAADEVCRRYRCYAGLVVGQ
ncbi:MAG: hypothetical protein IT307_10900 [Chloroflexi bacterium]|nr:hypothetical protein [Chloroflexota bacterium]